MADNSNILYIYFEILKTIYDKKDGVDSSYFIKNFGISKQNFSKYINQILNSDFGKYISVDTSKKTRIYKPALKELDRIIRYYTGDKYTYDELLALQSFEVFLDPKNEKELMDKFRQNFIAIDNPLQDKNLNKNEFNHIKTLLKSNLLNLKINIDYIDEIINDAVFLKIIYSDKNWYALISYDEKIELKRIAFIKNIVITKERYSSLSIPCNLDRKIKNLSNSLSLYDKNEYEAILEISPKIRRYFEKDMKKFFKSQKIINENPLQISIKYSQELEILRFIKAWLPDIKILAPIELKESFKICLKEALNDYE